MLRKMAMAEVYWNTYVGNDTRNPDAGVNLADAAQGLHDQLRVVEAVQKHNALTQEGFELTTTLRNLGGENLELEVAGPLVGVLDLADRVAGDEALPPFLIYVETGEMRDLVKNTLMKDGQGWKNIQQVDMEARSEDGR